MSNLKRRVEQLEEKRVQKMLEEFDRDLEGRSLEDVKYFCAHGYLPEVPIPGSAFVLERLSWKVRWEQWKESQRQVASHTVEECEFFCVNGHWPEDKSA